MMSAMSKGANWTPNYWFDEKREPSVAEPYRIARKSFEKRMAQGTRPLIYLMQRLAGGEYVSVFTEIAWKEYLAGWLDADGRDD